ncbi:hypothetical protein SAMN06265222_104283 [Neorhodopirellula lusitana]|uniref:Uncharacterized protein n=1 Tax=Neorhodopirellula lusitana TaxID=445327 RepID=A0ABY1Q010_9BACT|nr:hypothetical protein [Neorhodopirellula lusitana]SMP54713.1 hypothetical protein SAMN06265222_104283 [Neorhodopirellula lusitana]
MAKKKSGVNKSKEIRDYYAANPKAKPLEVVEAMKAKGIEVNAQFVSTVKSNSKKKTSKRGTTAKSASVAKTPARSAKRAVTAKRPGRKPANAASGEISLDSLIKAKSLANEMGGIENARLALSALEQLTD